jgi:hypothetical protein
MHTIIHAGTDSYRLYWPLTKNNLLVRYITKYRYEFATITNLIPISILNILSILSKLIERHEHCVPINLQGLIQGGEMFQTVYNSASFFTDPGCK